MPKTLKQLGKNTFQPVEIQNISHHGIWIFINHEELFMPFSQFPWFLNATIGQIYNLKVFHKTHLYWPELDIDLDVESIRHPDAYPLKYKQL